MKTTNLILLTILIYSSAFAQDSGVRTEAPVSPVKSTDDLTGIKVALFPDVEGVNENGNAIFIETNKDGFVFHKCEADVSGDSNSADNAAPLPSEDCPPLFNKWGQKDLPAGIDVIFPTHDFLEEGSGVKHALKIYLRALAGVTLTWANFASLGALSWTASFWQAALMVASPQPLALLKDENQIRRTMMSIENQIDRQKELGGKTVITSTLPLQYDDLKSSIIELGLKIEAREDRRFRKITAKINKHPEDQDLIDKRAATLRYKMESAVHTWYNDAYNAYEAKKAAPPAEANPKQ